MAGPAHYAVIDTETTGTDVLRDQITEIAVVRLDTAGRELSRFSATARPTRAIPREVSALNGLDADRLADSPPFAAHAASVAETLEGAILVAHNARFDVPVLAYELARAGLSLRSRAAACTLNLMRTLEPQADGFSLPVVCARHGVPFHETHRALPDALGTAGLVRMLLAGGTRPEEVEIDLHPYYQASAKGNLEPAHVGAVRRLKGLVIGMPAVRAGHIGPRRLLADLLGELGALLEVPSGGPADEAALAQACFTLTKEQCQRGIDLLAERGSRPHSKTVPPPLARAELAAEAAR